MSIARADAWKFVFKGYSWRRKPSVLAVVDSGGHIRTVSHAPRLYPPVSMMQIAHAEDTNDLGEGTYDDGDKSWLTLLSF